MKKRTTMILLTAALWALLAGCGMKTEPPAPSAPAPEPEPAAVPESPVPSQDLPALSSGQDAVQKTLSPSTSIPNPAMFHP